MRRATRTSVLVLSGVLVLLFIAGTVWDVRISEMFHNQNSVFGILGAAFGEWPTSLALVLAGGMLVLARNKQRRATGLVQVIGGVLLVLLGALMAVFMPGRYLDVNAAVLIAMGVVVVAATFWLSAWFVKQADRGVLIRTAVVLFLVVVAELILVNVVKVVWDRPRLRFLAENPDALFQPWYAIGNDTRDAWLAQGIASEEFKSFPSGHSANGAVLMLMVVLTRLKLAWHRHETLLFWIGALFGLLVAASRIVMGAHFLSDTVAGFSITFALVLVAMRVLTRRPANAPETAEVSV